MYIIDNHRSYRFLQYLIYLYWAMYIREYVVYNIFQLVEYLHARYRKKRLLVSFSFFHYSYTSTMFRTSLFFSYSGYSARHSPIRKDRMIFPFFLFSFSSLCQTISNSHLTVSLCRIFASLLHFWLSRGHFLFFAPRSSFHPARTWCRCCLPNSCIRVFLTGHRAFDRTWFEPYPPVGRTYPHTLSSIPPCPLDFYQPVDSPVATPIANATNIPLVPLIPASSHENRKSI